MKATEITNIKDFTKDLFVGERFDTFSLADASFVTRITVNIDGHVNPDFGKTANAENVSEETPVKETERDMIPWSEAKRLCYQVISGKILPVKFKIVLMVPREKIGSFLANIGSGKSPTDVGALSLNIKFEAGKLECITGTAMKTFDLDKSLENAWDDSMQAVLAKYTA